ncbi:MAG: hypothetical protein JSS72_04225 [Armatimonadetes bacterium]|nr:hypothetical protein [Armatimonadota bacterium]
MKPDWAIARKILYMKFVALFVVCSFALIVGCDKKASKEAEVAAGHAQQAVSLQWDAWRKQLENLDWSQPKAKWEEARKQLVEAQKRLEKDPNVKDAGKKLDEIGEKIKSVDLGLAAKDMQAKWDDAVKGIQKNGETYDQASKRLRESSDALKKQWDTLQESISKVKENTPKLDQNSGGE